MAAGLPSGVTVEIEFTPSVWTNVAGSISRPLTIDVGRQDESGDPQPGVLAVTLDNIDGTFTPDNPLSAYYPNLVEGKRIRVVITGSGGYGSGIYGSSTYMGTSIRFIGKISGIDPDFPDEPTQSTTRIAAVDIMGDLQAIEKMLPAHSALGAQYLVTDTSINNGAASRDPLLPKMTITYLSSNGSVDFASDSSFSADTEPCLTLTSGARLWHARPAFSGALNVGGLFKLTAGSPGEVFAVSVGKRTDAAFAAGTLLYATWDGIDKLTLSGGVGVNGVTPGWHYIKISKGGGASPVVMSIDDGTLNESITGSPYSGLVFSCLSVGGNLTLSVRDLHVSAPHTSFYRQAFGPASLTLQNDVDDLAYITSRTMSWTTTTTRAATPLASGGQTALDVLIALARSESGIAYVDYATEAIKLVARVDYRPTAVTMTVDAEADGIDGPKMSRSNAIKASTVTAKSPLSAITVSDPAVVGGSRDIDTRLASDVDLHAVASDGIARGRDQKLRLRQFTVDLVTAGNDLYAQLYAITPGKRVRYVVGAASTYFGYSWFDGFVEGWRETIGPSEYSVEFNLSPADAPAEAHWDTARWAFGDGVCTLQSSITSSGTTAVLTAAAPSNRLSAQDSGLESAGVGNWVVDANCTIANSTSQAHSGTHSLAQTSIAAGSMNCSLNFGAMIVAPGDAMYLAAWAFKAGTARNCQVGVSYYSRSLTALGFTAGAAVSVGGSAWTFVDSGATPIVAPAGAYYALPSLFCTAGAAAEVVFWDDVSVITPNMLTTDPAQYPLDLNINGERVTVSTAPTSCVAPQTVTIARGIAPSVARAHSAGEGVDVWDAARWAF